jgi:STE24 endopeptidase
MPLRPRTALGLLALGAAAWAAGAWALWPTDVPGDLRRPELDPDALFAREELREAERFETFLRWDTLAAQLVTVVVLALYAWRGHRLARESAAGRIGTGMLLGMLGLGILWFTQVPFGLAAVWWQRRHDVLELGYAEWLFGDWLGLAGEFGFICLALLIVMLFAGPLGHRWWIAGAPAFVALVTLFAWSYPHLVPETEPLRDPELRAVARSYAREQGIDPIPVRIERVSPYTRTPNAAAAGTGGSRTIFLWDTILDYRFSTEEVKVVLAHELAHHSREHILKGIGWYALFAVPGTFLIALATRRRGSLREARAVPLGLFVFVSLSLAAQPVFAVITRRMEAEADWVALETTEDPSAARELFRTFARTALADPDPPRWSTLLLATHPPMLERIEMAEAWRATRGRRAP